MSPQNLPQRTADDFLAGICVALQCVSAFDSGVLWAEIVNAVGKESLIKYAREVEPDEWTLAGFAKYAEAEIGIDMVLEGNDRK